MIDSKSTIQKGEELEPFQVAAAVPAVNEGDMGGADFCIGKRVVSVNFMLIISANRVKAA